MSMEKMELKVPVLGESIHEIELGEWLKKEGEPIQKDEPLAVLETDKATVELPAPATGRLVQVLRKAGDRVEVGGLLGYFEADAASSVPAPSPTAKAKAPPEEKAAPAAGRQQAVRTSGKTASLPPILQPAIPTSVPAVSPYEAEPTSQESSEPPAVSGEIEHRTPPVAAAAGPQPRSVSGVARDNGDRAEDRVPMSLLRRKIAERLVRAHSEAALLTTFNEIDMSAVLAIRKSHQERFQQRYQTKLGFMSFFVKAAIAALHEFPALNAEIRGTDMIYRRYFDIGIAIGSGRGLVVPVVRNAERMTFAQLEQAIADFAQQVKANQIKPEDLQGGTFTITNGGVYGSLLSTPIVNPPQSGVLGLHAIQERPIALAGQVVIRPMMYIALTYDHRIVDGREAVTFLKRVKDLIEDPVRMLVEI